MKIRLIIVLSLILQFFSSGISAQSQKSLNVDSKTVLTGIEDVFPGIKNSLSKQNTYQQANEKSEDGSAYLLIRGNQNEIFSLVLEYTEEPETTDTSTEINERNFDLIITLLKNVLSDWKESTRWVFKVQDEYRSREEASDEIIIDGKKIKLSIWVENPTDAWDVLLEDEWGMPTYMFSISGDIN